MGKPSDVRPAAVSLYFLPVETRVPLKFGPETCTAVTCARARMTVADASGRRAEGWGETPLNVQWVWVSDLSYEERREALKRFCVMLAEAWASFDATGHPMELGHEFQQRALPGLLARMNQERGADAEPMPWLAALVCCSVFDIALHDAYGVLHGCPVYETYGPGFMNCDLASYLTPAEGTQVSFEGKYIQDFLVSPRPDRLAAWHLIGGLDLLGESELDGTEPKDGYPVLLRDWIARDGLYCLKVKLRGNDAKWDYQRLVSVGQIAIEMGVDWLTSDFNCTVGHPNYVNAILDRLVEEYPRIYGMILYVEQPFPYDLEHNRIDVHSVSARKTCKTQTGALLSLCWAKAHGMTLMVQDLTNPMLAMIPHALLAAYAGTIMGVETNSSQFYPDASLAEEAVHPGLYRRRGGRVGLSTISGPGFGYRVGEIDRELPSVAAVYGS